MAKKTKTKNTKKKPTQGTQTGVQALALSSTSSTQLAQVVVSWLASHVDPEDVFPVNRLDEWAIDNGYAKIPPS